MSRKKQDSRVILLQEMREQLETLRENVSIDAVTVDFNTAEEEAFNTTILNPFDNLLADLDTFLSDVENGVYQEQVDLETDEEY